MIYPRACDPIDRHLAHVIRHERLAQGLTQAQVAKKLGISWQQVQKYEVAANRVSASRLYHIAGILGRRIGWFFEGVPRVGK